LSSAQDVHFKTEIELARLEVRALDSQQKPLLGLSADDFEVTENNSRREVKAVSHEELPLDLVLLIDVSGSMEDVVSSVASNAHDALSALHPGDRVAVATFDQNLLWYSALYADFELVEEAIRNATLRGNFGGGTVINSAILEAAKLLRRDGGKERRKAILMITDGYGRKGVRSNIVLRELWEGDITLNCLMLETLTSTRRRYQARKGKSSFLYALNADVQDFSEKTGGEVLYSNEAAQPLSEILRRIRAHYVVFYSPIESRVKERKVAAKLAPATQGRIPGAIAIGRRQYSLP